jgi:hypothetical protein
VAAVGVGAGQMGREVREAMEGPGRCGSLRFRRVLIRCAAVKSAVVDKKTTFRVERVLTQGSFNGKFVVLRARNEAKGQRWHGHGGGGKL